MWVKDKNATHELARRKEKTQLTTETVYTKYLRRWIARGANKSCWAGVKCAVACDKVGETVAALLTELKNGHVIGIR